MTVPDYIYLVSAAYAALCLARIAGVAGRVSTSLQEISMAERQQAAAFILGGNLGDEAKAALEAEMKKQVTA